MKSTRRFFSLLCAAGVILCASACSENNSPNNTAAPSSGSITVTSAPETDTDFTVTETSPASKEQTTTQQDANIVSETTSEAKKPTTTAAEEVISHGYDPGSPDIYLNIHTTDIYPDTDKITFSVDASKEYITTSGFEFFKETENGWEKLEQIEGTLMVDDSVTVSKDHQLVLNLYPADYGITFNAGENYRIAKEVGGQTYDIYFIVGGRSPELTENDIKMTIREGSSFKIGDNGFTLDYEYVGGAEYASYGFGCYYTLEKRNDKGEWEEVKFSDSAAFIELGYCISTEYPTNSTSVTLNDDFYAEPLMAGTYRVVKPIENNVTLTALFKINDKYNLEPSATDKDIKMTIGQVENGEEITTDYEYLTLNFSYIGEDNFAEFSFGSYFCLERENNGQWEEVEFAENVGWNDLAYLIGTEYPETTMEIYIGEKLFKEPLTEGRYRVVKPMNIVEDLFNLTAEFEIVSGHFSEKDFIVKTSPSALNKDAEKTIEISYEYIGNDSDINVWLYEDYRLQKLNSTGGWDEIPFSGGFKFGSTVQKITKDNLTVTEIIKLKDEYFAKQLTEGTYRIVKDLCDCTAVTAVFEINEPKSELTRSDIKMSVFEVENNKVITDKTKSITVTLDYTGNTDDAEYYIELGYSIEKREANGWEKVEFADGFSFNTLGCTIGSEYPSRTLICSLTPECFNKPLEVGKYRIVKPINDNLTLYGEFEIHDINLVEAPGEIDSENGSITLSINEITDSGFICSLPWPYPAVYTVRCNPDKYDNYCVGDNIEVDYSVMYKVSEWDFLIIPKRIYMSDFELDQNVAYKPVIYLYPEEETEVSVMLHYNGELTVTYPEYGDGWNVTAMPDGTLFDKNGNEYSYLFWEGESNIEYDFSKGFCVKGEDSAEFLREALSALGLTPREYNEFIVFWLPFMLENEYNVISFQSDCYTDNAVLSVTPDPDTVLRVFMAFYGSDEYVEIEEQELNTTERNGFTVVEWGGTKIKG